MAACIYIIVNKNTGKFYLGRSINHKKRWADHKKTLRGNRHRNPRLQNSWNFHGEGAFDFVMLFEAPKETLKELEGTLLKALWGLGILYNINKDPTGFEEGNKLGCFKRSDETKAKMSAASLGRVFSPEHRQRISAARKGTRASADARARMSAQRQRGGHPRAVKVQTPDGIFLCQNDAADFYGKSSAWVRKRCKNPSHPDFFLIRSNP